MTEDVKATVEKLFSPLPEEMQEAVEQDMVACADCGKLFAADGGRKLCKACAQERRNAGMRKRIEEKKRIRSEEIQRFKENIKEPDAGDVFDSEPVVSHFPALEEERRRKKQPVSVDLSNFKVKKPEPIGSSGLPVNHPVNLPQGDGDTEAHSDYCAEILEIAKSIVRLSDRIGVNPEALYDAVMHFAYGYAAADRIKICAGLGG